MKKIIPGKNTWSYLGIIASFFVFGYLFMFPILEGKRLKTSDLMLHEGMAKELNDYRDETGKEALWTNSMFCGMPGYLISAVYPGNLLSEITGPFTGSTYPAGIIIIYFIGFFVLLQTLKINKWLSLIGAFAYAFSTYFILIIGAGHATKAYAIGYLPLVVAGVIKTYRKEYLPGVLLFTAGLALEIKPAHYQITYYGIILLTIYVLTEFVFAFKEKKLKSFMVATAVLMVGTVAAVGINSAKLFTVYEYSKQTIRGPSELTKEKENRTTGLNKDYIVRWSQGIDETLALLIPNIKGGSSDFRPDRTSASYQTMQKNRMPNIQEGLNQVILYHGEKPGTSGPFYAGAIMVFLFVLSLFIVQGKLKWWLIIATCVSIVLSWGKHFMGLTNLLIEYLPLYNKFRATDTILVIAQFSIPLLGIIALQKIFSGETDKKQLLKGLKYAFFITGGITLLYSLLPGIFDDFSAPTDISTSTGKPIYPEWLMPSIVEDRKNLLREDAFRSFLFITLGTAVLYFAFYKEKIKPGVALLILGFLVATDLWVIDKRYLNKDNFVRPRENNYYDANVADKEILKDKDINYRVLPANNAFNDTHYSYYHKNIMGYHAAKLGRPHELMEHYLLEEMGELAEVINSQRIPTYMSPDFKIINMLNARYIIYSAQHPPLKNPYAMGNAWFVEEIKFVENADAEFEAIKSFNPSKTAIVDKRFEELLPEQKFPQNNNAKIEHTQYAPNYLKYLYDSPAKQFVVFSEVYYDKGWNAYIDGQKVPHVRTNYMLRGLMVPEGKHKIEFKFEPKSYAVGNKISYAGSILLFAVIFGYLIMFLYKKFKPVKQEKG